MLNRTRFLRSESISFPRRAFFLFAQIQYVLYTFRVLQFREIYLFFFFQYFIKVYHEILRFDENVFKKFNLKYHYTVVHIVRTSFEAFCEILFILKILI